MLGCRVNKENCFILTLIKNLKVCEFAVRFCIACTSPYPSKIKDISNTLHVHLMLFFLTATKSYKQVNNTKDPNFLQLHVLSTIKIACIGLPFALTTKTNNIACLKYHLQFFAVN